MYIYVCDTCKIVLTEVYENSSKIVKKTLLSLKYKPDDKLAYSSGYNQELIEEKLIDYTCPICGGNHVKGILVTENNFIQICKLLNEDKIKDAWETIFDTLL